MQQVLQARCEENARPHRVPDLRDGERESSRTLSQIQCQSQTVGAIHQLQAGIKLNLGAGTTACVRNGLDRRITGYGLPTPVLLHCMLTHRLMPSLFLPQMMPNGQLAHHHVQTAV